MPATSPAHTVTGNAKDFRRLTLHYHQNNPTTGAPITCDLTDRPSPTIGTMADRWTIEPNAVRLLNVELACLQGFPADWHWTGNKTQQAKMVGNAVPPALAEAVVRVNRPALERAA